MAAAVFVFTLTVTRNFNLVSRVLRIQPGGGVFVCVLGGGVGEVEGEVWRSSCGGDTIFEKA